MKHYTMRDFRTDEACLEMVFYSRFGRSVICPKCHKKGGFNLIASRKRFDCQCGYEIYPLAGTIFHGSATPLRLWFYAIYLFAYNRNGVAAKELERQLGVTYKTAWRISRQIRLIFNQQGALLDSEPAELIPPLETYKLRRQRRRNGEARPSVFMRAQHRESRITGVASHDYLQETVKSKIQEYVSNQLLFQNVDSFWPQLRSSIDDTHHIISTKYLQSYVDEVVFRYNNRRSPSRLFAVMLHQAVKQTPST